MTRVVAEDESQQAPKLDTNVPQTARIWNYWLGGKDNFAVDREVGDQIFQAYPDIVENARAARAFLVRAVSYLAGEAGVRQFLDIGTGLPTANNTHEVAQRIAPESRIVYVDNDPLVLVHARALLTSTPEGATEYIDADLREPDKILAAAAKLLDFSKPVALMLFGVVEFITDDDEAYGIVNPPEGCPAIRQLPGDVRRHQRHPQGGVGQDRPALERERFDAARPAQPRGNRPFLRRLGDPGTRHSLVHPVVARTQPVRTSLRGGRVLRRGPEAPLALRSHTGFRDRRSSQSSSAITSRRRTSS